MITTTVWVSIGNSDNRLTQRQWASLIRSVGELVEHSSVAVFTAAHSLPTQPYQNMHWGFNTTPKTQPEQMKRELARIAHLYNQDSIAWLEGETFFIQGV